MAIPPRQKIPAFIPSVKAIFAANLRQRFSEILARPNEFLLE